MHSTCSVRGQKSSLPPFCREQELLGRPLRGEEAGEVTGMARRLAGIVLLQPALDANYRIAEDHAYAWPPKKSSGWRRGRGNEDTG